MSLRPMRTGWLCATLTLLLFATAPLVAFNRPGRAAQSRGASQSSTAKTSAQSKDLVPEDIYAQIVGIEPSDPRITLVKVDRGSEDGLHQGAWATVFPREADATNTAEACRTDQTDNRENGQIGRAEVTEVRAHEALVKIELDNPSAPMGSVRVCDIIQLKALVPRRPESSLLWQIAKNHIVFMDADKKSIFDDFRGLYAEYSPAIEALIRQSVLEDLHAVTTRSKREILDSTKIQRGRYAGKTLREALEQSSSKDVDAFLGYVRDYPAKYIGHSYRFAESFAGWVISDAPPSGEEIEQQLRAADSPQRVTEILKSIEEDQIALNSTNAEKSQEERERVALVSLTGGLETLAERAESLAEKGLVTEADTSSRIVVEAAGMLSMTRPRNAEAQKTIARSLGGLLFHRGNVLRDERDDPGALAAFDQAIEQLNHVAGEPGAGEFLAATFNNRGQALLAMRRYGEALASLQEAERLKSQSGNPNLANTWWTEGTVFYNLNDLSKAADYYTRAISLYDRPGSVSGEFLLQCKQWLAGIYVRQGHLKEASQIYDEVRTRWKDQFDTDKEIQLLLDQGEALYKRGDYAEAEQSYRKGLAIADGASKKKLQADAHRGLGNALSAQYKFDQAVREFKSALDLYGSAKLGTRMEEAQTLLAEGDAEYLSGNYDASRAAYQHVVDLAKQLPPDDDFEERAVEQLGWLANTLGDSSKALQLYDRALALAKRRTNDYQLGWIYNGYASTYTSKGNGRKAQEYYQLALDSFRGLKYDYGVAALLNNSANDLKNQGDYEAALAKLEEARPISEKLQEPELTCAVLGTIAETYIQRNSPGDLDKAKELLASALKVSQAAQLKARTAEELELRGRLGRKQGEAQQAAHDTAGAEQAFQSADADYRQAGELWDKMKRIGAVAEAQKELGALALDRKQYAAAMPLLRKAIGVADKYQDKSLQWEALNFLSRVQEAQGQLLDARDSRAKAIVVLEDLRSAAAGGEQGKRTFLQSKIEVYESMVPLLIKLANSEKEQSRKTLWVGEAQHYLAVARIQSYAETVRSVSSTGNPKLDEVRKKEQAGAILENERADALRAGNLFKAGMITKILATNKVEVAALWNRIKVSDPQIARGLGTNPMKLMRLEDRLPENSALLAYFPGPDTLDVFVYLGDEPKIAQAPISEKQLYDLIKQYRDLINEVTNHIEHPEYGSLGRGFGPEAEKDASNPDWYRKNIQQTRLVLLDLCAALIPKEIRPFLEKTDTLLILPYEELNFLPFETLLRDDPQKGLVFLGQEKRISYFVNEDQFADTVGSDNGAPTSPGVWIGLADPQGRLGTSMNEAKLISGLFSNSELYCKNTAGETCQGPATRSQLKNLREDCSVLHIATHGFLSASDPSLTYLELQEVPPSDDGHFMQLDVYPNDGGVWVSPCFQKKHLRLVTLSACDTALANTKGQEMLGLPSAFYSAGAPAIIASLWEVETHSTADFMIRFYEAWIGNTKHEDKAAALQDAKEWLMTQENGKYAHPYYWAPFILYGDWR